MKKTFIASTLALAFISLCATEVLAADSQAPTATVTAPASGTNYKASSVPSPFTGTVADNPGSAVGVTANSTTFTLQRASDSKYWSGSTWQTAAANLATTHAATTDNSTVTWSSSGTLPTWSTETEGNYVVQATGKDRNNISAAGVAVTFTLDKTSPTAAIIYSPSGPVKAGTVLTITATFSEAMADSPVVKIAISGANTLAAANMTKTDTTHYTYSHTVGAGNGSATVALSTGTDVAGNLITTAPTSGVTFTVDNTAPAAPSTPDLDSASDSGASTSDNITSVTTPTFSGTAEDGSAVKIFSDAGQVGSATATGGSYSITTSTLSQGTHSITATATDAAGNVSSTSVALSVTIDTAGPTVTINQASGQSDPTPSFPIDFTVVFSESVSDFATGDVTLSGTAGATTATVTGSGTTYNVAVSGMTGSGTVIATLVAGVAHDVAGNGSSVSTSTDNTVTYDITVPTVSSINRTGANPTNANIVQFTVTFSESVSGVDATDFALAASGVSGASISGVSGSGSSYTVTVNTGSGDGTIGLNLVDDDSIIDGVGNPLGGAGSGNANFTGQTYTIDKTVPTVSSISRVGPSPTNGSSVQFTVTFSGSVSGVDSTDFALATSGVSGASITGVTGSGASYTVTVGTGTGSGTIGINLTDNDSIKDSANNALGGTGAGNGNFTGEVYTIDKSVPTVTINQASGQSDPASASPINFTVVFSESVSDFATGDVTVTGTAPGTKTATVSGSGTTYNVAVTGMTGGGTVIATLAASVAHDAAGNASSASTTTDNTVTYDTTAPTVSSINRASTSPTSAASVQFTVTFSESVSGVDATDFAVAASGVSGASITGVSGSGTTYTVTVNTGSGDGTLGLNLVDNDSITDLAGNQLGGAGAGNGNFTGQTYSVDKTAPGAPTTPDMTAASDTGASSTDNITSNHTPAFTGTAEAGSTVSIYSDGILVATGTATAYASPGITVSTLASGQHSITATATDTAGNVSASSGALNVIIGDTIAPASIGTANSTSADTSLAVSVPAAGVALGNTVIVTFAMDPTTGTVSVADSKGNTYSKDVDVINGSSGTGVRTVVFSAAVTNALVSGNSITVSYPSVSSKAVSAFSVSGLASASRVDRTNAAPGSGTSPSSGNTVLTTQPDELIIGAVGVEWRTTTFTAGSNFTALAGSVASVGGSGGAAQSIAIQPEYRLVSATNVYAATETLGSSENWSAAIVTYKISVPTVSSITRANAQTNSSSSVAFTVTFSESVSGVDVSDFSLATTGVAGASVASVSGSGTTYTVTVNTGTGSGTLGLNLVDDDSIADSNLIPLGGTGAANGNFTGQVYTIDKTTTTTAGNAAATYGDTSVNLTASVIATVPPHPSSGTVTFYVDGNSVGTASVVSGGTATLNYDPSSLTATSHTIGADFGGDGSLSASSSNPGQNGTLTISQKSVSPNITASSKTYDGTTAATIATRSPIGAVSGDDVSLTGGTAAFANKTVGTGKTVTATGLSLGGTKAGNYVLSSTSASTTANITARPLTISATGVNKGYDGGTTATVTLSDDRVSGDAITASYSTASFANKNVGTGKAVSVSGIGISGADSGNYSANTTASTTANITARALTVSATGVNKSYDGTTTATVTLSDDRVSGDTVTDAYTSASFATKNAGTGKTVSVSGISISGSDAGNYNLQNTTASTTADITARALTVSATGVNKVYDGTTNATVTLSDDRLSGDILTDNYTSASFANKCIGTGKAVSVSGISISGTDAANYDLQDTTASTTANITTRPLTVTATGINKVYDGNTSATVSLSDNRVSGDTFAETYSTATFSDSNVGTGKTVSVSGISIMLGASTNYALQNTTTTTTANITRPPTGTVTGLVELQSYVGTNATNTFVATDDAGHVLATWANVRLDIKAGSYVDTFRYALTGIPDGTTHLSAKAKVSLRRRLVVTFDGNNQAQLHFVNPTLVNPQLVDPSFIPASQISTNQLLLGGDITNDNVVNTPDYTLLRSRLNTASADADINGSGLVTQADYDIMKLNWYMTGDPQ